MKESDDTKKNDQRRQEDKYPKEIKILLVDDDESVLSLMERYLRYLNYKVLTATGGEAAVERFKTDNINIVITDIHMPEDKINGIELSKIISELKPDTEIIVISGHEDIEKIADALNAGAKDFLEKPFSKEKLYFVIQKAVNSITLRRQNDKVQSELYLALKDELVRVKFDLNFASDESKRIGVLFKGVIQNLRKRLENQSQEAIKLKEDLKKCRRNEQVAKKLLEESPIGVMVISYDYRITVANNSLVGLLEVPINEIKKLDINFYLPFVMSGVSQKITECIANGQSQIFECSYVSGKKQKKIIKIFLSAIPCNEEVLVQFFDITEEAIARQAIQRKAKEIERLAKIDELTGLYRQNLTNSIITKLFHKAKDSGEKLAVVHIDIDHFKKINDTYGHDVGDSVLRVVGKRISSAIKERDVGIRNGGDEFVIILADFEEKNLKKIVERIFGNIRGSYPIGDNRFVECRCSIGVASLNAGVSTPEVLMQRADYATYHAKKTRNKVVFYKNGMKMPNNNS